jgi:hypothetical protein
MEPNYASLEYALLRAKESLGFPISDTTRDTALIELLMISKGALLEEIIYRPYYAAARYLLTYVPDQKIISADGVTFRDAREIAMNLLEMQSVVDIALGLVLAPGTQVMNKKARNYSYGVVSMPTNNVWGGS